MTRHMDMTHAGDHLPKTSLVAPRPMDLSEKPLLKVRSCKQILRSSYRLRRRELRFVAR